MGSSCGPKQGLISNYVLPRIERPMTPGEPDGAVLCNFDMAMFKLKLAISRDGSLCRAVEDGGGQDYDRGIAFQGVARLRIFEGSEEGGT
jgi:hypothetical protein